MGLHHFGTNTRRRSVFAGDANGNSWELPESLINPRGWGTKLSPTTVSAERHTMLFSAAVMCMACVVLQSELQHPPTCESINATLT